VSVESVLHKLIDAVHPGNGSAKVAQDLHFEVDEPDAKPPVTPQEGE
jgi:hypothetical protein